MNNIKLIQCDTKAEDIELFKVFLDTEGQIKIEVSEDLKRNKTPEEIQELLKDNINDLDIIVKKIVQSMFYDYLCRQ